MRAGTVSLVFAVTQTAPDSGRPVVQECRYSQVGRTNGASSNCFLPATLCALLGKCKSFFAPTYWLIDPLRCDVCSVENDGDRRVSERVEDLMPLPGPSGPHDQSSASDGANDASSSSLSSGVTPLS